MGAIKTKLELITNEMFSLHYGIIKASCVYFFADGHAAEEEADCRRASSRGLIPRAKIKTVKMTLVIVFGE